MSSSTTLYILLGVTGVALGGTPLFGGRGGLTGSFFGAFVLFLIQTLLSNLNVAAAWLDIVYGALLIIGIVLGAAVLLRQPSRIASA